MKNSNSIIKECLEMLKKENIKYEIRNFCKPIMELILFEFRPYIYIIVSLIILIFIMILVILILLFLILRNNNLLSK